MTSTIVRAPLYDEFSRLLNSFDASSLEGPRSGLNFRIRSENDTAIAEVEVPGVDPADVRVHIEGRSLTVDTPRGSAYFTIGARIDAEHTTADLKHGLLTIRIPKRESRTVEVNVHSEG